MAFETARSEIVYQGRVFDVRRDQVRLPNGRLSTLDIVDHPGAVTLLPLDSEGRLWLVRQYRHSVGMDLLELPAGAMEEGEPPEACAYREVREEIGMSAGQLQKIGQFFLAPGYSTEYMYIFLATDLQSDPLDADEDEFLSVETIPVQEVYRLAETGVIQDSKTLAALFLARPQLESYLSGS
jgi:ADP-ribose pyrophosphatase